MGEAATYIEVVMAAVNAMLAIADAELSDTDMKELVFKIIKRSTDYLRIGD